MVIHSFSLQELEAAAGPGIESAKKAHQAGLAALDELQFRRKGLAASLIVILMAVAAIYLKIRQIESRKKVKKSRQELCRSRQGTFSTARKSKVLNAQAHRPFGKHTAVQWLVVWEA